MYFAVSPWWLLQFFPIFRFTFLCILLLITSYSLEQFHRSRWHHPPPLPTSVSKITGKVNTNLFLICFLSGLAAVHASGSGFYTNSSISYFLVFRLYKWENWNQQGLQFTYWSSFDSSTVVCLLVWIGAHCLLLQLIFLNSRYIVDWLYSYSYKGIIIAVVKYLETNKRIHSTLKR